jgi:hypothetical protein
MPEVAFVELPPAHCQFTYPAVRCTKERILVEDEDIAARLQHAVGCAQSGQTTTNCISATVLVRGLTDNDFGHAVWI